MLDDTIIGDDEKEICHAQELLIDIIECHPGALSGESINQFMEDLVNLMGLSVPEDQPEISLRKIEHREPKKDKGEKEPVFCGTVATNFFEFSNVTIRTSEEHNAVYINFMSCKNFKSKPLIDLAVRWFQGTLRNEYLIGRHC